MPVIYLSICIPTNGRIEIVKNTLDSIYLNCEVDYSEFEVILSDNSKTDELLQLLDSYKKYPNIVYSKTTSQGFLNSANALKLGNGLFLKLHNNYSIFNPGSLHKMISVIKALQDQRPLVFFTNGHLKRNDNQSFNSFNSFSNALSYWNSWSTGFSIWKSDFDENCEKELSNMFPQTSLLLFNSKKSLFVINDEIFFTNQEVPKKGGYNLFQTFCVDYLSLMNLAKENNIISLQTFNKIKKDLFYNYLVVAYYNTKIKKNELTFELNNIKKSLSFYYLKSQYYLLVFLSYNLAFKLSIRRLFVLLRIIKD